MKDYTVVTRGGFRVGVTEGGKGTPLVFLHGFSVSTGAYTEMLELLSQNGFHVYGIDAPDHGRSDSLPWGHTVKDMAEVIDQALDVLGVEVGAVLVGHSMGGRLAAEVAAIYPMLYDTVILLSAAVGKEFHEAVKVDGPGTLLRGAQFIAGALKDVFGDARKAKSLRTLSERLRLADMLRGSLSGPRIARAAYAMTQGDSSEALHALRRGRVKTVVVHGTDDAIIPSASALSAWQVLRGRIHILGGHFHSWMISDPELALRVINDALDLTDPEDEAV